MKPTAIFDAVTQPKKVIESSGGVKSYKGTNAKVVLNSEGKVITVSGSKRGTVDKNYSEPRKSGGGKAQRRTEKASGTNYNPNLIR